MFSIGRISPNESLFWYAEGYSPLNYTAGDFIPLFKVNTTADVDAEAKTACTGDDKKVNMECLYDFKTTGNEDLAKSTLQTETLNTEEAKILGNGLSTKHTDDKPFICEKTITIIIFQYITHVHFY